MHAETLCAIHYAASHPVDAARRLEHLPVPDGAAFLALLSDDVQRALVTALRPAHAARCLAALPRPEAAALLERLDTDVAAAIMRTTAAAPRTALLERCGSAARTRIEKLLRYAPGSAGAAMDPIVLTLQDGMTVGDARKELVRHAASTYYYVYVVRPDNQLLGVLDLRELLTAEPSAAVGSVMQRDVTSISPHSDLDSLANHPAWQDVDALPVTDAEHRLLGIVRHRTLRRMARAGVATQHLEELGITLVRLGEIYWASLGMLLAGATTALATGAAQHPDRSIT